MGANLYFAELEPERSPEDLPKPGEEPDWVADLVDGGPLEIEDPDDVPTEPLPDWAGDDDDE